jgi:ribonuclease III
MPVSFSRNIKNLEREIGYSFGNRDLLIEALTHRSFYHENPAKTKTCSERLEFLGDSVLGLVISEFLFRHDREFTEAMMSKIKSYLVKGVLLSDIAIRISLGSCLRLGKGEEDTGGRHKKSLLADATEAVFGAIYIDSGYETAKEVILRLFEERIESVISSGQFHDYKTELQEKSQMLFGVLPEYRVTRQEGEEHSKTFTIEVFIAETVRGTGQGKSKKEAETVAAREALESLTRVDSPGPKR